VRILARRAKGIADEALLRTFLAGASGGSGGGGGASQALLYVNTQGGVDAPGNGTFAHPYATLVYAMSQITDASPSKVYTVWVAGGAYAAPNIKPNVSIVGIDPFNVPFISGTLGLDASFGNSDSADCSYCDFVDPVNLNLSSLANSTLGFWACEFSGNFTISLGTLCELSTLLCDFSGDTTATITSGVAWDSFNDTFDRGFTLTINASSTPATVQMNGSAVESALVLNGSGIIYEYTHNSALPKSGITLSGGAVAGSLQPLNVAGLWEVQTNGGAVTAGYLLKPSGSGYVPLATTDDSGACVGVSLDTVTSAGFSLRSQNIGQTVTVVNDGAAAIAIGDRIIPSTTAAGQVTHSAVSGKATVGVATSAAAATPGATFSMYFQPGQV
jgi:hypothetical protein